jgi:hypothetical protein
MREFASGTPGGTRAVARLAVLRELRLHPLFTLTRRLPGLCQATPNETRIRGTCRVRHTTRDETGSKADGTHHESVGPVVVDEVDWFVGTFENGDQPIGVALRGRLRSLWQPRPDLQGAMLPSVEK